MAVLDDGYWEGKQEQYCKVVAKNVYYTVEYIRAYVTSGLY